MRMTKENRAKSLLVSLVANTHYENGEMLKAENIADVASQLVQLKIYADWIEFSELLLYLLSELRRVRNGYITGSLSISDCIEVAERLHNNLINVPLPYLFYFELPGGLNLNKEITLSQGVTLKSIDGATVSRLKKVNQFTYLRSSYDGLGNLTTKPKPTYIVLKPDTVYLEVKANGFVSESKVLSEDIDPTHIYRLLIAFMVLRGILTLGGMMHMLTDKYSISYGKSFTVYRDTLEFISDTPRHIDEANYIASLVFNKSLVKGGLDLLLRDFKKLISPMSNEYLEAERNKIVNSLYWFFEGEKSENDAFKLLMKVSMFDSFYEQSRDQNLTIRSILETCGYSPGDKKIWEEKRMALKTIYDERNDIGHGNVRLLELARSGKLSTSYKLNSPVLIVGNLYKEFIELKIQKLLS